MKIIIIVGTRPNFIKAFPVYHALKPDHDLKLIHTGQHYDKNMSQIFFEELKFPEPDINLNITGSPIQQTAEVMTKLETIFLQENPDLVIVFGDVTSTLAGALVASKLNIKLAHVESGLRSFDRTMPEEINRILTDKLADILFVTEPSGLLNLKKENITNNIFYVGNTMIDTLFKFKDQARKLKVCRKYGLVEKNYILVTIHRVNNVDENLEQIVKTLNKLSEKYQVIFPVHPRTQKKINQKNKFIIIEPVGYLEFISLMIDSQLVLTDSGGIQEETTALNIPCLTARPNTERPITITHGTNQLISLDLLETRTDQIMNGDLRIGFREIKLWDGKASERIAEILKKNIF